MGPSPKLFLKEREARRYVLIRFSSAGDYHYEHLETDEITRLAKALSEMSANMQQKS